MRRAGVRFSTTDRKLTEKIRYIYVIIIIIHTVVKPFLECSALQNLGFDHDDAIQDLKMFFDWLIHVEKRQLHIRNYAATGVLPLFKPLKHSTTMHIKPKPRLENTQTVRHCKPVMAV